MYVAIEHIGLDSVVGDLNVIQPIDETKPLDEIKKTIINSVGNELEDLIILYKPIIKIIHTDEREYLLTVGFIVEKQPFNTNGDSSKNPKFKVIWRPVNNTHPTQSTGM